MLKGFKSIESRLILWVLGGVTLIFALTYYLLYLLFGIGATLILAVAFGLVRVGYEPALAVWAGLNAHPGRDPVAAALFGFCVWALLWIAKRFRVGPLVASARVGIACGVALVIWPELFGTGVFQYLPPDPFRLESASFDASKIGP
jgi:hypothetical protein